MKARNKRFLACILAMLTALSCVPIYAGAQEQGLPDLPSLPSIGKEYPTSYGTEELSGTYTLTIPKNDYYSISVDDERVIEETEEAVTLGYEYAEHVKIPVTARSPMSIQGIELESNQGEKEELYIQSTTKDAIEFDMPDTNVTANISLYNKMWRITPTNDSNNIYVTGRTGQQAIQVIYNGSKYGTYKMWYKNVATNEEVFAFCCEHTKYSPVNGATYVSIEDYSNENIKKAAYYGYNGPANIFTDEATGLVYTHLAFHYFFTGDSSYNKVCQSFLDTLNTLPNPHGNASLSKTQLTGRDNGSGTLVTETVTLDAFARNKFYFDLPDQVTIHLTSGGSQTGGRCFVTGGQSFYFTAPAGYDTPYSSGAVKGDYMEPVLSLATPKSSMTQKLIGVEYENNSDSISFEINWEQSKKYGHLELTKHDGQTNTLLPGAEFTIYAWDGNAYSNKVASMTSTDGRYVSPELEANNTNKGKFKVIETKAPEGYEIGTPYEAEFTIEKDGQTVTISDPVINQPIHGDVTVKKTVTNTGTLLSGVTFKVYAWNKDINDYEDAEIDVLNETATGIYQSTKPYYYSLTNLGKFKIVETKAPEGYSGGWSQEFQLTADETSFNFTAENIREYFVKGSITVHKEDALTGERLSGAEFKLYEWSNADQTYHYFKDFTFKKTTKEYLVSDVKGTDANGGKFKIVETKLPDGYYGPWEKEIVLEEGQTSYTYKAPNTPIQGVIQVEKVSENGARLSGAVFEVTALENIVSQNGTVLVNKDQVVATLTTGKDGIAQSPKLYLGRYQVKEVTAPEGYVISNNPKEVVLKASGDETEAKVSVQFKNKLATAEVTVVKRIKSDDIVWAHGNPIFVYDLEGTDIEGEKHSYACAIEFTPEDKLNPDKEGYISLQYTFENVPIGNYEIFENRTNRYELVKVTPNTENVSIRENGGKVDPTADIVLTDVLKAKVTYTNDKTRFDDYSHTDLIRNVIPIKQ